MLGFSVAGGAMAFEDVTKVLGGWEGFEIAEVSRKEGSDRSAPVVVITLHRVQGHQSRCGKCGSVVVDVHEIVERRIRELPIMDAETVLVVPVARVRCVGCGPTTEAISWVRHHARLTKRFEKFVSDLASKLSIKDVAEFFRLSWATVKRIDKKRLRKEFGVIDLSGVRQIAIDEFSLHKGQRYATVVMDAERRRVIWVGNGRRREDLRSFFTLLGAEGCSRIEAVVMDMSDAYEKETRANCPNATIVYDLFHMMAHFTTTVVDRVRMDETNRIARPQKRPSVQKKRAVLKGTKWLLLHNRENLSAAERIKLKELLSLNYRLYVTYVLKDAFRDLWRYSYRGAALRAWRQWYSWAVRSRIDPLVRYAKKLKHRLSGILSHCIYRLNTSVLEGINNKIKVLKRMAYGYRDDEYFFLKIKAAFPGNRR
jgi:transposase